MRYTKSTLQKIEKLFGENGYAVRYEKGNFQSGYCVVMNKKIAIVNKFLDTKARIESLIEILSRLEIQDQLFDVNNNNSVDADQEEKLKLAS